MQLGSDTGCEGRAVVGVNKVWPDVPAEVFKELSPSDGVVMDVNEAIIIVMQLGALWGDGDVIATASYQNGLVVLGPLRTCRRPFR